MITLPMISTSGSGQTRSASATSSDQSSDLDLAQDTLAAGSDETSAFATLLGHRVSLQSQTQQATPGQTAVTPETLATLNSADEKNPFVKTRIATLVTSDPGLIAKSDAPQAISSTATHLLASENGEEQPTSLQDDHQSADIQALFAMLPVDIQSINRAAPKKTISDGDDTAKLTSGAAASNTSLLAGLQNEKNNLRSNTTAQTKDSQQPKSNELTAISVENRDLMAQAASAAQGQAITPANAEIDSRGTSANTGSTTPSLTVASHSLHPQMAAVSNDAAMTPSSGVAQIHSPLGSQEWQQSLNQHIALFTRQGQQSAEIRLHPEDLGSIQISLKLDNDHAQLNLMSGHAQVRSALEAAIPQLRSALADNGITLGQSQVSSDNFPQNSGFANQQQSQTARDNSQSGLNTTSSGNDDDSALPLVTPASLQSRLNSTNSVDIFA